MARKLAYRRSRGHSLPELFVTLALFGLLTTISLIALTQSQDVFRKASGRDNVARTMTKAWSWLRKDLANASPNLGSTMDIQKAPGSLDVAAADGDGISFLTPSDPVTGDLKNSADGTPFYMRQITYYLSTPTDHDTIYHQSCTGAADASGYEVQCPHKVLVRKMDNPAPTPDPTVPATQDTWNSTWLTLCTRPVGIGSTNDNNKIIATNLLTFRVTAVTSPGASGPDILQLDLRAVAVDEAQRQVPVGKTPLGVSQYTITQVTSVVPRNQ